MGRSINKEKKENRKLLVLILVFVFLLILYLLHTYFFSNMLLNRIIGHFGKGLITKKFEEFKEIYGITITEVNAAFTSQECNECGYINRANRKNQEDFCCIQCNLI